MLMAVLWRLGDSCGSVLKRAREHNVDFLYFLLFLCFLGGFLFWVSEKNEKAIRASLGLRSGPMVRLMGVVYHGRLKIRVDHRPLDLVLSEKELALVRGAEVLKRISLSCVKNFELSHAQKTATTGAIGVSVGSVAVGIPISSDKSTISFWVRTTGEDLLFSLTTARGLDSLQELTNFCKRANLAVQTMVGPQPKLERKDLRGNSELHE